MVTSNETRPYSQKRILHDYIDRSWIHFEYIRIQIYSRWKKKKFDFSKNTFKMPDKKFELRKAVWGVRVGGDV